jgi:hypothetical protein
MTPLNTDLRGRLEDAVKRARVEAEQGARRTVEALAVHKREPFGSMTTSEQALRRRLRAHGRQLGDVLDRSGEQTIHRLVREIAYEQWHRMLFARFLAENHLLIEPQLGVAITLKECADLARERGEDPWALAASFAQGMLPRIFRTGDPALEVLLPPETRLSLQSLLGGLPREVFLEDDSLGWTYQFWQSAEKDAVNERVRSGEKITGETLPAVTQLFTEPYMVHFLLHNTIGAWHAGKIRPESVWVTAESEAELRAMARLVPGGGYDFEYLRFVREPGEEGPENSAAPWRPAAGTYPGWPKAAKDLRVLDPCCGSGHFLVAAFELLVRLRMQEEGLEATAAARAVLAENLFGLELDARCTQIAAFNLALAAWKFVGKSIALPPLRIACSGIGPRATKEEWLELATEAAAAGGMPGARDLFGTEDTLLSAGVRHGLGELYDVFEQAPELGSLIDLKGAAQLDALQADFTQLEPLLDAILQREGSGEDEVERAVAAKGMAEAVRILAGPKGGYTLVLTNVPFKKRGELNRWFNAWARRHYQEAKADLATIFVARMLRWVGSRAGVGTVAVVTPQNWLFLSSYRGFRETLLKTADWNCVALLGSSAFRDMNWWAATTALTILSARHDGSSTSLAAFNVGGDKDPETKARFLAGKEVAGERLSDGFSGGRLVGPILLRQAEQLNNPDARIVLTERTGLPLLQQYAVSLQGISPADVKHYGRQCWEVRLGTVMKPWQTTVRESCCFGGRSLLLWWGPDLLSAFSDGVAYLRGSNAWGRQGVVVSQMRHLPVTIYGGDAFDTNAAVLLPHDPSHLPAIWAYCSSPEYLKAVRSIDQAPKVTNATLVKVPFDLGHWQKVAKEQYPNGLPEPYSDDPTQWLFHGHPAQANPGTELHVAVARLLGYRWPAELDPEMRLAPEARALIQKCTELDAHGFPDADGVVGLVSMRGESPAADRLRELLAAAYGTAWSGAKERELLATTAAATHGNGRRMDTLEHWLRDAFFEEHCKLYHHRPFIWHVWDGPRGGFGALVNYHCLAGPEGEGRRTLEALTFAYLGEWIERQRSAREAGREGGDARLAMALHLQQELQKILEGEAPYDIFVRWKPLHEQPLGWEPDINDGVRLNIRPFLRAADVGRKGAGILRWAPNVKWGKDGGKEPQSIRPRADFPWFWGCLPEKKAPHRTDFGTGLPNTAPAGAEFTGARWNDLHYTRASKEAARARAVKGATS